MSIEIKSDILAKELNQGIVPLGVPKAYKYDAALVEAARAAVNQGIDDVAEAGDTAKAAVEAQVTASVNAVSAQEQASKADVNALGDKILAQMKHGYGYPFTAATAAAMTDTAKIYVYTGSETGYTNGNWYYWNGTAWTSGGVYNATALETDKTLTVSGAAADAKVVGVKLKSINEINDLYSVKEYVIHTSYESGSIVDNSNTLVADDTRIRTVDYIPALGSCAQLHFSIPSGLYICLFEFDADYNFNAERYWFSGDCALYLLPNTKYVKWNVKNKANDNTITPSDGFSITCKEVQRNMDTAIKEIFKRNCSKDDLSFIYGRISDGTGKIDSNNTNRLTQFYTFKMYEGDILIAIDPTISFTVYQYEEDADLTYVGYINDSDNSSRMQYFKAPQDMLVRFSMRKNDDGNLSVDDAFDYISLIRKATYNKEDQKFYLDYGSYADDSGVHVYSGYVDTNNTIDRFRGRRSSKNKIHVRKGDIFRATGGYKFVLYMFDYEGNYLGYSSSFAESFTMKNDCYVGINIAYRPNGVDEVIPDSDDKILTKITYIPIINTIGKKQLSDIFMNNNLIAHRGGNAGAENTIENFAIAVSNGYKILECDINFTSDNIPVLLHDNTIDRTSNGTGNVSSYTLKQLRNFDFGPNGEKIPTLEEFLLFCKQNDVVAELDFADTSKDINASKIQIIYNIAKVTGMLHKTIFTCYEERANIVTTMDDSLAVSVGGLSTVNDINNIAYLKYNTALLIGSMPYATFSKQLVEACHNNNILAKTWTVDTVDGVKTAYSYGCDYIITDNIKPSDITNNN